MKTSQTPATSAKEIPLRSILKDGQKIESSHVSEEHFEQARTNKILPFLVHKLQELGDIEPELRDRARITHDSYISRSTAILSELQAVFQQFDQNGIDGVIVVENFATVVATDACLGCFASGDVDLMARYSDHEEIERALSQAGWQKNRRRSKDKGLMSSFSKQLSGEEFYLNFEWKAVSRSWFRNEKSLTERITFFRNQGFIHRISGISVLKNEANFYLNCMHLSIGHYYGTTPGLRLYKDMELHLKDPEFTFDMAVKWAKEDGTLTRLETCLQLYKDIYDPSYVAPISVGRRAKGIAAFVKKLNDPMNLNHFDLYQQIKIDSMSDHSNLVSYMTRRIVTKLLSRA